ncbi:unnamed protein product [Peniophora sp. CBMAI 1063]|nr:unnamed protein product [Peniophora sp. CBMAI 1063]
MAEAPINVKLLLIGNSSVGKSSLLLRFSDQQWLPEDEASATIGVDFRVHKMDVKGKKVKLSIWDTAGQERFRTITSSYYRGAQGIILVYDVSNRETFDALPRWYSELETYEYTRQVPTAEAEAFANRMGSLFIEASAKTSVGVREAFRNVVEQIIDTPELWGNATKSGGASSGRKAPASASNQTMPGTIDLSGDAGDEQGGGCGC